MSLEADLAAAERYRPIAGDWEAFAAALARPLPGCAWTNRRRTTPERVAVELGRVAGGEPLPLPWYPGAFRLPADARPGGSVAHAAGLFHLQEEVSLLPVALLDPRPGERILDLCAAPGGKTAQIAAALGASGTVVANDRAWQRVRAMGANLDRLGAVTVATTVYDAASFPEAGGPYDRVLADVPCSCEGTSRKAPGVIGRAARLDRADLARRQRAILAKAVRLCRPGGRIVYSTCTYAPEENEAVVDDVLAAAGVGLRLAGAAVPGLRTSPGLVSWRGRSFHPSLERALRVWPQANDTGGFFVAVLEKEDGPEPGPPELLEAPPVDPAPWLEPLLRTYGLPASTFDGLALHRGSVKRLSIAAADLAPPGHPRPQALGLPFLRTDMERPKPTTAAAMAFGAAAARQVVEVGRAGAEAYLARRPLAPGVAQPVGGTTPGQVLVRWREVCLGVGLLRPGGAVESLFPKAWAI